MSTVSYVTVGREFFLHWFTISDTHTHSVGLPWMRDRPISVSKFVTFSPFALRQTRGYILRQSKHFRAS